MAPNVRFFLFTPLIFLFLAVSIAMPADDHTRELILKNEKGEVVFSTPIGPHDAFAIRYTHSVAQSPVTDYFKVGENGIFLTRTVYKDFGAGLPHCPENGQTMVLKNGEMEIGKINRNLNSFDVRVGRVAGHVLILLKGDTPIREIPLNSLTSGGKAINFSVDSVEAR